MVSEAEGFEFAEKNQCLFFEASAKNDIRVKECFEEIIKISSRIQLEEIQKADLRKITQAREELSSIRID